MFEIRDGLIPKERYLSREFLDLERERLWPRVWQVACREEELPTVGSYVEYEIAGQSILVMRSAEDRIQAFFNACLHRGTKLCVARGAVAEIRCPFHGWCWNLDGTNREVLDAQEFAGLEHEKLRLRECRVGRWGGFVFINMDTEAASLEDFLGPLPEQLAPYHLEQMVYQSYRTTILPCNWKTAIDAFIEAYHMKGTHSQAMASVDEVNARHEGFGLHSRMIVPLGTPSARLEPRPPETEILRVMVSSLLDVQLLSEDAARALQQLGDEKLAAGMTARQFFGGLARERGQANGLDLSGFSDEQMMEDWGYHLFPNLWWNTQPGEVFGFRFRPNGSDPESCIFDVISLHRPAPDATHRPVAVEFVDDFRWHDWGTTLMQDMVNLPKIQSGMHSRSFSTVRLASRQESLIRRSHENLDHYLGIGGASHRESNRRQ